MSVYENCSFEDFPHTKHNNNGFRMLYAKEDEPSLRVLCDVVYRQVEEQALHLHILLPTQDKECKQCFPLLVYIQGSAWKQQSTGKELAQLCRFAQRGYVIAIVQYRDSSQAVFPAQILDAKYAIDFMMQHARMYFVDKERLYVWGDSSGAHTAMMCAFTKHNENFLEENLTEYTISGVIDYYGPTDITKMKDEPSTMQHDHKDSPGGCLIGNKEVLYENAKDTIVMNYIVNDKPIPPVLILHGSKDRLVPFHQSILLYEKMTDLNKEVEAYKLYDGDHGGSPFWNHEVLNIVDTFIKKHDVCARKNV